jgi:hypothetical protein
MPSTCRREVEKWQREEGELQRVAINRERLNVEEEEDLGKTSRASFFHHVCFIYFYFFKISFNYT